MKGLLILDGPDGAGKTTLANKFVELYGAKYMHLTYRFKDKMFTYQLAALNRAVKLSKDHLVIVDRHWMSELCYANAYRGGSKWPYAYHVFDRIILKNSGLYIYCLPVNLRDHLHAFECLKDQRNEMYNDIGPVVIEYHKLWEKVKSWPHVVRYDYQSTPLEMIKDFCSSVVERLKTWQDEQWPRGASHDEFNFAGHISPAKFLFIGSKNTSRVKKWYPFASYDTGAEQLSAALHKGGIEPHEVVWTDYLEDSTVTKELLNTYDLVPIIMGTDAYTKLISEMGWGKASNNPQRIYHPVDYSSFFKDKGFYWSLMEVIVRVRAFRLKEF